MQDRVTEDFNLPGPAVARVDLNAVIVRTEDGTRVLLLMAARTGRRPVAPDVLLDPLQHGGSTLRDGAMVLEHVAPGGGEHQLHLPGIAAPRSQQRIRGHFGAGIVRPPQSPRGPVVGQFRPEDRGGVQ